MSTVFYKCIAYFQTFGKAHEKSISRIDIFTNSVVKVRFSRKDFQRHRQARSVSSLSAIVKLRLTMTHESYTMNSLYLDFCK